jgi:D-alanine--poly(phosphoribitol) ligase subunit 2
MMCTMERQRVLSILKKIKPNIDFESNKRLLDDGVLDSFDVVTLVSELNQAFEIEVPVDELKSENLNSADSIYNLIFKLQKNT